MEYGENITEDYPLKGNNSYSLSKIQAEQFLSDWCNEHDVILGILRPSLLAGKNPPGNLGDMIKGIATNRYLSIAGGKAKKSVLMVEDIARILPALIERGGIYNVCDDEHPSFRELGNINSRTIREKSPPSIPIGWPSQWLWQVICWERKLR